MFEKQHTNQPTRGVFFLEDDEKDIDDFRFFKKLFRKNDPQFHVLRKSKKKKNVVRSMGEEEEEKKKTKKKKKRRIFVYTTPPF